MYATGLVFLQMIFGRPIYTKKNFTKYFKHSRQQFDIGHVRKSS